MTLHTAPDYESAAASIDHRDDCPDPDAASYPDQEDTHR